MKMSEFTTKSFLGNAGAAENSYILINYEDNTTQRPVTYKASLQEIGKAIANDQKLYKKTQNGAITTNVSQGAYVNTAAENFASTGAVTAAVQGLASTGYVTSAINTATANLVDSTSFNGLSSTVSTLTSLVSEMDAALDRMESCATLMDVSTAVEGLASTGAVTAAIQGLASTGAVTAAVQGLASTGAVTAAVSGLASTGYVTTAISGYVVASEFESAIANFASTGYVANLVPEYIVTGSADGLYWTNYQDSVQHLLMPPHYDAHHFYVIASTDGELYYVNGSDTYLLSNLIHE